MPQVGEVDDAIYQTLFANGTLTYNKLHSKTQELKKCTTQTFDNHLKELVSDNLILRKKIPNKQMVEYSLNHDISDLVRGNIKMIDDGIKLSKSLHKVTSSFFKKNSKYLSDYQNFTHKELGALDLCVNGIIISLRLSSSCTLMLTSGLLARVQAKKVKHLQKLTDDYAKEIFLSVKKLNLYAYGSLYQLVFHKMGSSLNVDDLKSF